MESSDDVGGVREFERRAGAFWVGSGGAGDSGGPLARRRGPGVGRDCGGSVRGGAGGVGQACWQACWPVFQQYTEVDRPGGLSYQVYVATALGFRVAAAEFPRS